MKPRMKLTTRYRYHLAALFCVTVWGATFVSTKVLIANSLTPAEIFLMRFAAAYILLLALSHAKLRADSLRDEAMLAAGQESPYAEWLANWDDSRSRTTTTRLDVGTWYERRDRALLAHATQIDPDGWFFKVPLDVQRQIWPHEDFEAARSVVPIVPGEDDLFAGLPSVAEADVWATSPDLEFVVDNVKERVS